MELASWFWATMNGLEITGRVKGLRGKESGSRKAFQV